jgi:hypothetical protein
VAKDFHLRVYVREPARRGAPHRDSVFGARIDGVAVADDRAALDGIAGEISDRLSTCPPSRPLGSCSMSRPTDTDSPPVTTPAMEFS